MVWSKTMKSPVPPGDPRPNVNPWLIIMLTAPIPLFLVGFLLVKWYTENSDLKRTTRYFVQRQNTVLAYDAMEVSSGISDLLEKTARDVRIMGLLPRNAQAFSRFYAEQMSDYTQFYTENEPPKSVPLPFFNHQLVLSPSGDVRLRLIDGKVDTSLKKVSDCQLKDLCDRELLERALKLKVGEHWFGRVVRYYSPDGKPDDSDRASLDVAYRAADAILVLGIDFKHLKDHMTTPTFPYEAKRNLLKSYANGNYIYIVDSDNNVIVHPKYWHQAGIDRSTGNWMPPMKVDADEGKKFLSISAYQGSRLKNYFDRLMKVSFQTKGVDIFQAPNLGGTLRVLSVAPIFLSKGQFKTTDVFGHVIIGCNVEYFEEPSEKLVPYY